MEWWIALIVVAALGIAAAAAVGGMGEMTKDPVRDVYRQDLPARPLGAADLDTLRFGITLRGYAMGQVDDLLDRVAVELAERDALIAELTGHDALTELERRRHQPAFPPPVDHPDEVAPFARPVSSEDPDDQRDVAADRFDAPDDHHPEPVEDADAPGVDPAATGAALDDPVRRP